VQFQALWLVLFGSFDESMQYDHMSLNNATKQRSTNCFSALGAHLEKPITKGARIWQTQVWTRDLHLLRNAKKLALIPGGQATMDARTLALKN